MSSEIQALQARWEAFHAKLKERVRAILEEAEPGCLAVFEQGGFDPFTLSNVLPALKRRLFDLVETAENTWTTQMDPALGRAAAGPEVVDREYDKLQALRAWTEAELEAFEVRLHATASRILWARLGPTVPTRLNCTQCGSPMELPVAFVVVSVHCPSCTSVNTFNPGPAALLDSYAIRHLAHEEVWEIRTGAEPMPEPQRLRETSTYQAEVEAWERRYGMRDYPIREPY